MNHRRLASAAAATIAAALLGVSITAAAAPAHPAGPATGQKVIVDCLNKKQVEPRSFVLTCADGNAYLSGIKWTSWTSQLGSATATFVVNDCNPYCAAGHFHSYPALIMTWGNAAFKGSQRYTEMTMVFPGKRPPIFNGHKYVPGPQTETFPLFAMP